MTGLGPRLPRLHLLDALSADRGAVLHILRLVLAAVTVGAVVGFGVGGPEPFDVLQLVALWLLATGGAEAIGRTGLVSPERLATGLLLVDGVWLALIRHNTGGTTSGLAALVIVHLVAATMLTGHRTGLRLALWHGVLAMVGYVAEISSGHDARLDALTTDSGAASVMAVAGLLAVAVTVAVFSSVNERELRRGRADMEALAAMSTVLHNTAVLDEMVATGLTRLQMSSGMARAALLVRWQDAYLLWGPDGRRHSDQLIVTGDDLHVRQAWSEQRTALVGQLSPIADPDLAAALPGARNVVIVPLVAGGEPFAVMAVERGGRTWSQIASSRVTLIEQLAERLALGVHSALLHREVRRLADADALTGLGNRRLFDERLVQEFGRHHRTGRPLSLVLIDVDHFKQVNDSHGHPVGDEVLRVLGTLIGAECREIDIACRFGGEELVVVVPDAGHAAAVVLAERIRGAVAGHAALPTPVTVSIGVASAPLHATDAAGLVAAADAALYASKEAGRNRVTVADVDPTGALVDPARAGVASGR